MMKIKMAMPAVLARQKDQELFSRDLLQRIEQGKGMAAGEMLSHLEVDDETSIAIAFQVEELAEEEAGDRRNNESHHCR
jgi:hypothetical protein